MIEKHIAEATSMFPESRIVGVFLQGSQNYGLSTKDSDVDTKCILVPTFNDIALNKKPISTTHVLDNNEHLDLKDIRLYIETFYKQNLNFLEILFTPYKYINPLYKEEWQHLIDNREAIAHMNPVRAAKSMKGIAHEKFHAMEHPYPSKIEIIQKYGYDGKQVSHLLRVYDYLSRYIDGESYESCLRPSAHIRQRILDYKAQLIPLEEAREEASRYINWIDALEARFCSGKEAEEDAKTRWLLEDVCCRIMKISIKKEIGEF